MIFSCARCETRYKLPDDKVTNRVVKVRCRRCGVIIVVRDPSRARSAHVETEAVWFVAIDGEQRGPLSAAAVRGLAEAGSLGQASFVWKAGMGDWLPAREVPEMLALLSPPTLPLEAIEEVELDVEPEVLDEEVSESASAPSAEDESPAEEAFIETPVAKSTADGAASAAADQATVDAEPDSDVTQEVAATSDAEDDDALAPHAPPEPSAPPMAPTALDPDTLADTRAAEPSEATEPEASSQDASSEEPDQERGADDDAGLDEGDPTTLISRDDLPFEVIPPADDGVSTVQDAPAALGDEMDTIDEGAPVDLGPPTRIEAPAEPTIDTAAAGAPEPEDVATQPETAAAPDPDAVSRPSEPEASTDPLALADDLFAGLEGAMDTSVLQRMAARKPVSTRDLERIPDPDPDPEVVLTDADKEFFKRAMKKRTGGRTMSITEVESLDKEEMAKLRQEFDVIGTLESAQRKRKVVAFVTIALVVAGVVGAIALYTSQRESAREAMRLQYQSDGSVPVAERRTVYEAKPIAPTETTDVIEDVSVEPTPEEIAENEKKERLERLAKWEAQKAVIAKKKVQQTQESRSKYEKMSAAEYEALMSDSSGKKETKLKFSARKASEDAAKEAAAKRKKRSDARAAEVVAAFGRKRSQLARCKSGEDEKVRVQFTVAPNGRVTSVKVTGAKNSTKSSCVKGILKQAIFPKGPDTNTYAMPITL